MNRPADVCGALLAALSAAEGRRRSRKRDQRPDAIGLALKRALLERVIRDDPDAARFEERLLEHVRALPEGADAMARSVLDEWRLARAMPEFAAWLERGAPSEDVA